MLRDTKQNRTEQLKVKSTLPALSFNFTELKAWAESLTERYINLVVTENDIAVVKDDMAALNKAKKAVDDARKEAVKRVSEPIKTFEAQIKTICEIFDAAYSGLSAQVKRFEDAQREEKRKVVEGIIFEMGMPNVAGWPPGFSPANITMQERWLNKSTSLKSIREDIAAIIERHVEEEQRRKALEQARQDRAAAIENHVKALNQQHSLYMAVGNFLAIGYGMDLNVPLARVLRHIDQTFAQKMETERQTQKAKHDATTSLDVPTEAPFYDSKSKPQAAMAQTRAMSIVLKYDIVNEAEVKACLENLKSLCVNYGVRYR